MAMTTTGEQRRRESHERVLAACMEHDAAAVALISRIGVAFANHDTAPDRTKMGHPATMCPTY